MNTKLHSICDCRGRPRNLFVTVRQVGDCIGARGLLSSLPVADRLLGELLLERHWSERQWRLVPSRVERQEKTRLHSRPVITQESRQT